MADSLSAAYIFLSRLLCGKSVIRIRGRKFESLAETQTIHGAQNQCGRKRDHDSAVAEHDQLAARQAFGQSASNHNQKNRPEDRYGCEGANKEVAVVVGGSSHV